MIVQITISAGRTLGQKRTLFRRIADNLAALGLRRLGEASCAPAPEKVPA